MRNRAYIVTLIVIVMQTMATLYASISASDSIVSISKPQDSISQQLDTLRKDSNAPAPIKKKSVKSAQKSIKQEEKTDKVIDINLEFSVINDSTDLLAQNIISPDSCQNAQDSILAEHDSNSYDIISNGQIYSYKGKTVPHVLSEWAFPLIIMLFAFGFPFIFNGITRLEEKYHSEELSTIITHSRIYRFYKYILIISVSISAIYCVGLLTPRFEVNWLLFAGYILKIIGTIAVTISAILFIISTILLVRDLFLYNDATKLFEKWNNKWDINDKKDSITTRIIFSLYDYALRQEKKELLNAVEKKLLSLVENYRNYKAPKNNKRYALDYPEPLLVSVYSLYENTLKTSNPQYQNRVIRLYCDVIFDRTNTLEDLPRIILSDTILEHFWKMSKVTTIYKSESAFAILWTNIADYYCFLVNHDNTKKEQENILDLCFVIGAFNYIKKAGANLEFALSYTVGYYKNEKMSFTFMENVLYRYYRCTNDYIFAKTTGIDVYEKYKIFDYEKATKKQQIAPLTQYGAFLILRIYNQGAYLMQFDPIALRKNLFNQEKSSSNRLTLNLVDTLRNKTLTTIEKSIFSIKKTMSKEEVDIFARNLMTSSEKNENIRLGETPISEYWQQQFEKRISQELHVTCFDLQKILRAPKRQIQYGFSTSGSTALSYTNDTQKTIDFEYPGQVDKVTSSIWTEPLIVISPKRNFVYATFIQSPENIFNIAKNISENVYKKHVNRIAATLLTMKKGNASWTTSPEDLAKRLSLCIEEKDLIIYISSKDETNIYAPISLLKNDISYKYDHGQSTYRNLPIIVLNGNVLDKELYDKVSMSFIALRRDELPIISPRNLINDLSSYNLDYNDYKETDVAMLKISISLEAMLTYQKDVCKFIRYKHLKKKKINN